TMNLAAEYRQLTSLSPLFLSQVPITDVTFWDNAEVKRKYQTTVILNMQGPLLAPEFDFDIDISDIPQTLTVREINFSTTLSAFKNEIESDEQELNRQVFSLIVLRKFAEKGSFSVPDNSVGSSVSEFVSNQLSYWITQLDENLEVNLDLGAIDQKTTKTFQLTLSYSLADGRLRITRAGNIYADQTGNDVSNIIGDWTIEYMLTPDGKLRAKMYNKFNYNSLTGTIQDNTTTSTGFSLMHTQGFDKFNELIQKPKNRKKEKQKSRYIQYKEGVIPSESMEQPEDDSTGNN
ncbi:MAG TPA: translocation/assembly module TamB domain-containing protein, partial [Cyclobacteriaceae bacterium]|nr:translocation/assembly module TamB domain-containing protein [Cyclobacteriaceae bacterium]